MATQHGPTPTAVVDKDQTLHIEAQCDSHQKLAMPEIEKVDHFGAHTKTDPKEIALVRKLDIYMLVSLLEIGLPCVRSLILIFS